MIKELGMKKVEALITKKKKSITITQREYAELIAQYEEKVLLLKKEKMLYNIRHGKEIQHTVSKSRLNTECAKLFIQI